MTALLGVQNNLTHSPSSSTLHMVVLVSEWMVLDSATVSVFLCVLPHLSNNLTIFSVNHLPTTRGRPAAGECTPGGQGRRRNWTDAYLFIFLSMPHVHLHFPTNIYWNSHYNHDTVTTTTVVFCHLYAFTPVLWPWWGICPLPRTS